MENGNKFTMTYKTKRRIQIILHFKGSHFLQVDYKKVYQ